MMQLMASSTVNDRDMRDALKVIAKSPTQAVYLVDSYGALYSEQVRDYVRMYLDAMEGTNIEVGFHGHNNQQLAFANTIEAIIAGANRVDTTICGIGRGAGNCPMELMIGFLHNPKFKLRPVLEACRDVVQPLSKKMHWGYSIPYAIAGQLNQHPRAAIEWHAGKTVDDCVAFHDLAIAED
jgi:4-hydroxy 2-oxovalerate aldolase